MGPGPDPGPISKTFFQKTRPEKMKMPYFLKTKKTRSAILINFQVVSRLDLCSEVQS